MENNDTTKRTTDNAFPNQRNHLRKIVRAINAAGGWGEWTDREDDTLLHTEDEILDAAFACDEVILSVLHAERKVRSFLLLVPDIHNEDEPELLVADYGASLDRFVEGR